jgi:hypothetical protein
MCFAFSLFCEEFVMSNDFNRFPLITDVMPPLDSRPTAIVGSFGYLPAGVPWLDQMLGGWRLERLSGFLAADHSEMYWRLLISIVGGFLKQGGHVDLIGSPLPSTHVRPTIHPDWGESPQDIESFNSFAAPLVNALQGLVEQTQVYLPGRIAELPNLLATKVTKPKRMIVISSIEWLIAREFRRSTNWDEKLEFVRQLTLMLRRLGAQLSAAVVLIGRHDCLKISMARDTTQLPFRTLFRRAESLGAFVSLHDHPVLQEITVACGGTYVGQNHQLNLEWKEEGWLTIGKYKKLA